MLKKRIVKNIILIICSVVFSVYLIEGIMRVMNSYIFREDLIIQRINQAKKLGIPFDKRSKRNVVNDLRTQGIDAYPVLPPFYLLKDNLELNFLPIGTISQKVMVLANETGTFETFTSDEHGFRNPQEYWGKGQTDILIVGDSFAMGANVRSGADIRSQLASYGRKVISLGMNGNGPLLKLAGLCEYGKHLKPNIVLWLYYEHNDLSDLAKNKECPLLKRYLNDNFSQDLLNRQNEIDQKYIEFYEHFCKQKDTSSKKYKSVLFRFLALNYLRNRLKLLENVKQSQLTLYETILRKSKNLSASWGGKLIYVYVPDYFRYFYKKDDRYASRDQVLATVKKLDIPIIDFHETIKKQKDPLDLFPFRVHGHFTEAGYQLLAATIMNELQKKVFAKDRIN